MWWLFFLLLLGAGCVAPTQSVNLGCCDPGADPSSHPEKCDAFSEFFIDGEPITTLPEYNEFLSGSVIKNSSCSGDECRVVLLTNVGGQRAELTVDVPICREEGGCGVGCTFIACTPYTREAFPLGGGDLLEFFDLVMEHCHGSLECASNLIGRSVALPQVVGQNLLYSTCSLVRAESKEDIQALKRQRVMGFFIGLGRDLREGLLAEYLPTSDFYCAINPIGKRDRYINYFIPQLFPPSADNHIPNLLHQYALSGTPSHCREDPNLKAYYFERNGKRYYFPTLFSCAYYEKFGQSLLKRNGTTPSDVLAYLMNAPIVGERKASYDEATILTALPYLPPFEVEAAPSLRALVKDMPSGNTYDSILEAPTTIPFVYLLGERIPVSRLELLLGSLSQGNITFVPLSFYSLPPYQPCLTVPASQLKDCAESGNCPSGLSRGEATVQGQGSQLHLVYVSADSCGGGVFIYRSTFNGEEGPSPLKDAVGMASTHPTALFFKKDPSPPDIGLLSDLLTISKPYSKDRLEELLERRDFLFYLSPSFYSLSFSLPYLYSSLLPNLITDSTFTYTGSDATGQPVSYDRTLYIQNPLYFYGEESFQFDYECKTPQECLSGNCRKDRYSRTLIYILDGGQERAVVNSFCRDVGGGLACDPLPITQAPTPSGREDVVFSSSPLSQPIPLLVAQERKYEEGGMDKWSLRGYVLKVERRKPPTFGKVKRLMLNGRPLQVALFLPPNALPTSVGGKEAAFPISWYEPVYQWAYSALGSTPLPMANVVDESRDGGDYQRDGPVLKAVVAHAQSSHRAIVKDGMAVPQWIHTCSRDTDLNPGYKDGEEGEEGRWDKGFNFDSNPLFGRVIASWCEGYFCYMGSGKGFSDKCDNSGGSLSKAFGWPIGIDLFKALAMAQQYGTTYNLGNFSLFPVCGLEREFVLCANPLFRDARLTELAVRHNAVEYVVPLSYTNMSKGVAVEIRPWGVVRENAYYISGYPPDNDSERALLNEYKMRVIAYSGLSAEEAAQVCGALKEEDFCLSGVCFIERGVAYGTYAPSLLVVGDFNGDGLIGRRCVADPTTVIKYESYGWCEGCSGVNGRAVQLYEWEGRYPPTVSGVWNGTHVRGINTVGYLDKVDGVELPTEYYEIEEGPLGDVKNIQYREDLSWPQLYPPQGLLKEKVREWLRRGMVVLVFPDGDVLKNQSLFLFRDLLDVKDTPAFPDAERVDVPTGAMVVVLPFSSQLPSNVERVKEQCPTCIPAVFLPPSQLSAFYSSLGLSSGEVCGRRGIPGRICREPYPDLGGVVLGYTATVDPCSSQQSYDLVEEWVEQAKNISHTVGLPTIIYVERLRSSQPVDGEGYAVCDGERVPAFAPFFEAVALHKKELINAGVWGIHIEDLSRFPSQDTQEFYLYEGLNPKGGRMEQFNAFLRLAVRDVVLYPKEVDLSPECRDEGCIKPSQCINKEDERGNEVNPQGLPLSDITVVCSDGWRGKAGELLGSASPMAQLRLGSLFFHTGVALCNEKAYTLLPVPVEVPSAFAFCEKGDVECHKRGVDLQHYLSLLTAFPDVVCWAEVD